MGANAGKRKYLDIYGINNNNLEFGDFSDYEYSNPNRGYEIVRPKIDYKLNESKYGEEYLLFEGIEGSPKYENPEVIWENFIQWIEKRQQQMTALKMDKESYEYKLGNQLIEAARDYNPHGIFFLMKRNWVEFRDNYLCAERCSEDIMEFVRAVLYKKMTEKQMWGSDEDRMPGGKVIIFDKKFMPKEGEDTGKLQFEYRPNYREEMLRGQNG